MSARPPSRNSGAENFPVGSLLISRRLRPSVAAFYAAARAADDIADDPNLNGAEKRKQLDRFEAALNGDLEGIDVASAIRAREALDGTGLGHLRQLLRAFRHDAVQPRCADWDALLAYCADSANPVGHFLLDLQDEEPSDYPQSDALCTALQVLNHLQDCGDDYRMLDRIYLPADWMVELGVPESTLAGTQATQGLREVLRRCLDEIDLLLAEAAPLPLRLRSTRLALESAAILALAEALAERLKRQDPLAGRVQLSRPAMLGIGLRAAAGCLWRRLFAPRERDRSHPA